MASETVLIVLNGATFLNAAQRTALVKWVKEGMEPITRAAGAELVVTLQRPKDKPGPSVYHLEVTFEIEDVPKRRCGFVLAECGSGTISITRHQYMGICGDDPKTRNQRFLTTDELLGHALANTALHELGHKIGNFDDNRNAGDFMSTLGPDRKDRDKGSMRAFFAGTMSWTTAQQRVLIDNIKAGRMAWDDEFTVTPGAP